MKKHRTLFIIIGACLLVFFFVISYWAWLPRYGTVEIPGEGTYTGQLKGNNIFHGEGTYTSVLGVSYEGEWKNSLFHGQGTITYANGAQIIGEFENGYIVGMGLTISPDGVEQEVNFDNLRLGKEIVFDGGCSCCDHDH